MIRKGGAIARGARLFWGLARDGGSAQHLPVRKNAEALCIRVGEDLNPIRSSAMKWSNILVMLDQSKQE
jgi:hypothetical protein